MTNLIEGGLYIGSTYFYGYVSVNESECTISVYDKNTKLIIVTVSTLGRKYSLNDSYDTNHVLVYRQAILDRGYHE